MKKIIIVFLILLMPLFVKADLTKDQQDDVALFATKMITEGSKAPHLDSRGFPILAYNQGTRREGFQNKLAYMWKDYNGRNGIYANKWTFDCASFAAYVYHHCFGINTIGNNNNPYLVSSFVSDATLKHNFYFVGNNWNTSTMDYSKIQKGDLVVFVGSHIMVYVGDGKIAHFSSMAIVTGSNLGAEVVDLKTKFPNRKCGIIRLKDGIISPTAKANMKITWPDTNQEQDFSEPKEEPDNKPTVTLSYKNENNKPVITINLSDDKGLTGYYISTKKETPNSWQSINNVKTYTATYEPDNNATYYCYVKDSKNQISNSKIKVSGLDKEKPVISNVIYKYIKDSDSFNLDIKATDTNKITYALDNDTYQESNTFNNVPKGKHKIYVKDASNNIAEFEFDLSSDLIPTINLNYEKNPSKMVIVRIDGVDTQGINGYNVTRTNDEPKTYLTYNNNASYTVRTNGDYYFWIRNTRGTVNYQKITITNIDSSSPIISNVKIERKNGFFTVEITASDDGCGIGGYSLDGSTYQNENMFSDAKTIYNKVYVKDKCNNVATYDVDINNIPGEEEDSGTTLLLILIILVVLGFIIYNLIGINKKR